MLDFAFSLDESLMVKVGLFLLWPSTPTLMLIFSFYVGDMNSDSRVPEDFSFGNGLYSAPTSKAPVSKSLFDSRCSLGIAFISVFESLFSVIFLIG